LSVEGMRVEGRGLRIKGLRPRHSLPASAIDMREVTPALVRGLGVGVGVGVRG